MNIKTSIEGCRHGWARVAYSILISLLFIVAGPTLAQDGSTGSSPADIPAGDLAPLALRYPAGSIDSVEKADLALRDTTVERVAIEEKFAAEESQCQQRFFVNTCLDAAKERRRGALKQVRPIEIESDTFKRKARVIERDQALAERAAQEELEKPERLKQQQENEAAAAQRAAAKTTDVKPVESEATVPDLRGAQHEAKLRQLRAEEAANAQKRADNIAEYEAKVKEAQERQREIAARKQEKEKQRADKVPATSAQ